MSFFIGTAHNGRHAMLESSLYNGEVGVRERAGGQLELAWFGRAPTLRGPVGGTLDGAAVTITGLRSRPINSGSALELQANPVRAIVATAKL